MAVEVQFAQLQLVIEQQRVATYAYNALHNLQVGDAMYNAIAREHKHDTDATRAAIKKLVSILTAPAPLYCSHYGPTPLRSTIRAHTIMRGQAMPMHLDHIHTQQHRFKPRRLCWTNSISRRRSYGVR